jgi:uncharacterized iron-regulated membrane protein
MTPFEIVRYFVCLFGGLALMMGGTVWAMRHPRQKGEPISRERKAWVAVMALGFVLVIAGLFTL